MRWSTGCMRRWKVLRWIVASRTRCQRGNMVRVDASSFAPSAPPRPPPIDETLEVSHIHVTSKVAAADPLVRGPAVDHEEAAGILAEHLLGDTRAAAPGDLEDGHQRARRGPEPGVAFGLAQAGLVGVHYRLLAEVRARLLDWRGQRLADFALAVADRAGASPTPRKSESNSCVTRFSSDGRRCRPRSAT